MQREVEIGPDDSAGSLYYQRIFPAGVDLVLESVALIDAGRAPRVTQDESRASYEPLCRDAHAAIEWTQPARRVHDLIRGCDPQPGAHTPVGDKRLRLYESRRVEGQGAPGTVLALAVDGMTIATAEGAVRVAKARVDGHARQARGGRRGGGARDHGRRAAGVERRVRDVVAGRVSSTSCYGGRARRRDR